MPEIGLINCIFKPITNSYLKASIPSPKHIHFHPNQTITVNVQLTWPLPGTQHTDPGGRPHWGWMATFHHHRTQPQLLKMCSTWWDITPFNTQHSTLGLCRWASFWGKLSSAGEHGEMPEGKWWLSGAQSIWKAPKREQEAQGDPRYSV